MRKLVFLALLLPSFLFSSEQPFFHPPDDWLVSDPTFYAPSVDICFIPKKKKGFSPSINLAIEEDVPSLDDYLSTIRSLHLAKQSTRWRKLGALNAQGIDGILTEIDTSSDGRDFRMLQCIFTYKNNAYILTAAALKSEMSRYLEDFLKAFKSFTISQNLLESIPDTKRQESLKAQLSELQARRSEIGFEKKVWKPFEKHFIKEFADMGSHWQILILKEEKKRHEKVHS